MKKLLAFLLLISSTTFAQEPFIKISSNTLLQNAIHVFSSDGAPLEKLQYMIGATSPTRAILVISPKKLPDKVTQNQGLFYDFFTSDKNGEIVKPIAKGDKVVTVSAIGIKILLEDRTGFASFVKFLLDK